MFLSNAMWASKVDKKEPIIVKVYFWGLGWIFAKKVSLVMEDFLLYPQSTGKLEAEEKTYPFWNCQIVQLFKNGSPRTLPKNMSIWAAILRETTQFIAPTDKLRNYCVFVLQISPGICKKRQISGICCYKLFHLKLFSNSKQMMRNELQFLNFQNLYRFYCLWMSYLW